MNFRIQARAMDTGPDTDTDIDAAGAASRAVDKAAQRVSLLRMHTLII